MLLYVFVVGCFFLEGGGGMCRPQDTRLLVYHAVEYIVLGSL